MKNKLNKYTITNTMKKKEIIINNNFQNFHIKENTRKRNKIIKNIKWKKILLSCLFNNYYPNYTHFINLSCTMDKVYLCRKLQGFRMCVLLLVFVKSCMCVIWVVVVKKTR